MAQATPYSYTERKRIRKRYLALCEGELAEPRTIDAPLARVGAITFGVREGGKRAITHVHPLCATPDGSLLDIELETGRTHQARVHLSAVGHPLVGDWLYGAASAVRPMLHAAPRNTGESQWGGRSMRSAMPRSRSATSVSRPAALATQLAYVVTDSSTRSSLAWS